MSEASGRFIPPTSSLLVSPLLLNPSGYTVCRRPARSALRLHSQSPINRLLLSILRFSRLFGPSFERICSRYKKIALVTDFYIPFNDSLISDYIRRPFSKPHSETVQGLALIVDSEHSEDVSAPAIEVPRDYHYTTAPVDSIEPPICD